MSDVIGRQLKREAKPSLRPFFSTRVAVAAREEQSNRRRRWLAVYWMVAIAASIYILIYAPVSSRVLRDAAPALIPVAVVTAAFYRRSIRRAVESYFR